MHNAERDEGKFFALSSSRVSPSLPFSIFFLLHNSFLKLISSMSERCGERESGGKREGEREEIVSYGGGEEE
jgi:hypothetical protein